MIGKRTPIFCDLDPGQIGTTETGDPFFKNRGGREWEVAELTLLIGVWRMSRLVIGRL